MAPEPSDELDERFLAIIDRWRGPLVGILTAWRVQRPQELAQDVLAEFWLTRSRYRGDWANAGGAGPWLRGIAWNLARAERRRTAWGPRAISDADAVTVAADEQGPEEVAMAAEGHAAIRAAIEELSDDQRAVVYMRLLEGSSGRDVASFLGISERAVEGRLRRARQELARILRDSGAGVDDAEPEGMAPRMGDGISEGAR